MWLERYINILDEVGWDEETDFLKGLDRVRIDEKPLPGYAFPMKSQGTTQWLLEPGLHTLTVGMTGSGKSRRLIAPAILNCIQSGASAFVLDVKGELSAMTSSLAKKQGYAVTTIDLRNPEKSDAYNPLEVAAQMYRKGDEKKAEDAINKVADIVFPMPSATSSTDPFWNRSCAQILTGLALFCLEGLSETPTFEKVEALLNKFDPERPSSFRTLLLVEVGRKAACLNKLSVLLSASEKTAGNILSSFYGLYGDYVRDPGMRKLLSSHSLDFEKLSKKKSIIYFVVDDSTKAAHGLARMIVKQIYEQLTAFAQSRPDRKLPIPFHFFLDEVGNGAPLDGLDSMTSMSRSRGISIHMALQSLTQLDALYGPAQAETIRSNFSVLFILNTMSQPTWKLCSELCNVNRVGEALIMPHEIAQIKLGQALIIRRGHRPYMTSLEDVSKHPNYYGE